MKRRFSVASTSSYGGPSRKYRRSASGSRKGKGPAKTSGGYIALARNPLPYVLNATLRYAEQFQVAPVSGAISVQVFSANGLYDPDTSGVGHQPRGFDEIIALYNHYVVTKASCQVDFATKTAGIPVICGITVLGYNTPLAANSYLEDRHTVFKVLGGSDSNAVTRLSINAPIGQFLGNRDVVDDPECKGSAVANPTEQVHFHVWCCTLNDTTTITVNQLLMMDFDTKFQEPIIPAQS